MNTQFQYLIRAPRKAWVQAYATWPKFAVEVAVRCKPGTVVIDNNLENVWRGLTVCAGRVAIGSAITAGSDLLSSLCWLTPLKQSCLAVPAGSFWLNLPLFVRI